MQEDIYWSLICFSRHNYFSVVLPYFIFAECAIAWLLFLLRSIYSTVSIKMDLQVGVDVIHCKRALQPQIQKHRTVVMSLFSRRTNILRYNRIDWIFLLLTTEEKSYLNGLFSCTADKWYLIVEQEKLILSCLLFLIFIIWFINGHHILHSFWTKNIYINAGWYSGYLL